MSTYSSSLRIELITTGDQAGTWGNTTNTNLGTLMEAGITGYTSVAVASANQAFTANNGAADEARNMTIALTTSTGANFAVYAPPAEKTYVIYNASAYTATLYNSTVIGNTTAAGTGVAIAAGKTMTVWSDGTNFAFQNTLLVGNVVGDVVGNVTGNVTGNLNGNLTAASPTAATQAPGTNNTTVATTAFVQAAASPAFPSGTVMLFVQTAAPTGWTKSTTHDNKALRIVSGAASSGGTAAFSTVFSNQTPTITTSGLSAGATTLTTAQMPAHTHTVGGVLGSGTLSFVPCGSQGSATATTSSTGGGGSHTHTVTGTATSSAITLDIQYVDVIIATKN